MSNVTLAFLNLHRMATLSCLNDLLFYLIWFDSLNCYHPTAPIGWYIRLVWVRRRGLMLGSSPRSWCSIPSPSIAETFCDAPRRRAGRLLRLFRFSSNPCRFPLQSSVLLASSTLSSLLFAGEERRHFFAVSLCTSFSSVSLICTGSCLSLQTSPPLWTAECGLLFEAVNHFGPLGGSVAARASHLLTAIVPRETPWSWKYDFSSLSYCPGSSKWSRLWDALAWKWSIIGASNRGYTFHR